MSHKEALLSIKNLSRSYPERSEKIFENISLDLHQGDFCVLMGKSGTGKTTLVRLIVGELTPPRGTIHYRTDDLATYGQEDLEQYRKKLGIIFQDYRLFEQESVRKNIAYPLEIFGLGTSIIQAKVDQCIKQYHLGPIIDTPIHLLSAGEKQKVCLARALIHHPEFIVADEPTGNLDREHSQAVADILIEANKAGNTILLITHDIHLVHYLKHKYKVTLHILK